MWWENTFLLFFINRFKCWNICITPVFPYAFLLFFIHNQSNYSRCRTKDKHFFMMNCCMKEQLAISWLSFWRFDFVLWLRLICLILYHNLYAKCNFSLWRMKITWNGIYNRIELYTKRKFSYFMQHVDFHLLWHQLLLSNKKLYIILLYFPILFEQYFTFLENNVIHLFYSFYNIVIPTNFNEKIINSFEITSLKSIYWIMNFMCIFLFFQKISYKIKKGPSF